MKAEEKRAEEYLQSLNLGRVIFEPHGNVAPDFEVGDVIAVEVRRLNQNYERGGKFRSLEEDQIPLLTKIQKLLRGFAPRTEEVYGNSWFVSYTINRRPIDGWRVLQPKLKEFLDWFYRSDKSVTEYRVTSNLTVSLIPASNRLETFYLLGGYSDHEAGGWLISELTKNIAICIEDKVRVLDSLCKYKERWLLLIDHIGYGAKEQFSIDRRGWDRVILLAPHGPLTAYEPDSGQQ